MREVIQILKKAGFPLKQIMEITGKRKFNSSLQINKSSKKNSSANNRILDLDHLYDCMSPPSELDNYNGNLNHLKYS